jgi:TorA maturation chaperone TorD
MTTAQPIRFATADQGEETARADLYGLLAVLFAAPASLALLESIAASPATGEGVLAQAWRALADAALLMRDDRRGGAEAVRDEYERLFIGIGKPEVMLYGSFYLSGFLMEKPLAALRTDLAHLGLERAEDVVDSEDHIASLCEVMRYLIAADGDDDGGDAHAGATPLDERTRLALQKTFFGVHMQPWVGEMCAALIRHPQSRFYRAVAELAQQFFEVEAQAFDMD